MIDNNQFKPQFEPVIFPAVSEGDDVLLKIEYFDSTGSHKDRESRRIIEYCLANNVNQLGCASTGNFGISLAAHCKMADIQCHVWISTETNMIKQHLLELQGATIHKVDTTGLSIYSTSNLQMKEMGVFNANPGECYLKVEANKVIGHEIHKSNHSVDYVVCPTNNGTLLKGVWKGLQESGNKVKMIGAIAKHSKLASSISGNLGLDSPEQVYKESGGMGISVTDLQIQEAHRALLSMGVFCEPSSAASLAAARILKADPESSNSIVLCVITGCGLKK